jgi:hypothetical protein
MYRHDNLRSVLAESSGLTLSCIYVGDLTSDRRLTLLFPGGVSPTYVFRFIRQRTRTELLQFILSLVLHFGTDTVKRQVFILFPSFQMNVVLRFNLVWMYSYTQHLIRVCHSASHRDSNPHGPLS